MHLNLHFSAFFYLTMLFYDSIARISNSCCGTSNYAFHVNLSRICGVQRFEVTSVGSDQAGKFNHLLHDYSSEVESD